MTISELRAVLEMLEPGAGLYVRDDGTPAIVVSVSSRHVFFRRDDDGELLRLSREAFARRYRRAADA